MYEDVITLIGLTAPSQETETQIRTIISLTVSRLKNLLMLSSEVGIPSELEYIVTEVSVRRYNRIGSEGLASHSVEGETMTWPDDDFKPYADDIQKYLERQEDATTGRVRFL